MMDYKSKMQDLFTNGRIGFDRSELSEMDLPQSSRDFLWKQGLPGPAHQEIALGVHFLDRFLKHAIGNQVFWQFGYEWDPGQLIALQETTGAVYAIDTDKNTVPVFVNGDLRVFLQALNLYREYTEDRATQTAPIQHYSAEEAKQRLSDFRSGRISRMPNPKVGSTGKAVYQRLAALFEVRDPQVLQRRNSWWSFIMEQLTDGLL